MAKNQKPKAQTSVVKATPKTQLNAMGKRTKRGFNAEGVANGLNKAIRCGEDYMEAYHMGEYYRSKRACDGVIAFINGAVEYAEAYVEKAKDEGNDLDAMTSKSIAKAIGYVKMLEALTHTKQQV